MGSTDKTFILSESGHIAGIVNPPSKGKYGHYTSEGPMTTPEEWKAGATRHDGSWWPRWGKWLAPRSGKMVPARQPQAVLAPAPGTYVSATPDAA
jgi:polyhydroxyalkanoate synthase